MEKVPHPKSRRTKTTAPQFARHVRLWIVRLEAPAPAPANDNAGGSRKKVA